MAGGAWIGELEMNPEDWVVGALERNYPSIAGRVTGLKGLQEDRAAEIWLGITRDIYAVIPLAKATAAVVKAARVFIEEMERLKRDGYGYPLPASKAVLADALSILDQENPA